MRITKQTKAYRATIRVCNKLSLRGRYGCYFSNDINFEFCTFFCSFSQQESPVWREQGPRQAALPQRHVAGPAREPRHRGRPQVGPRSRRGAIVVRLSLLRGPGTIFCSVVRFHDVDVTFHNVVKIYKCVLFIVQGVPSAHGPKLD